MRECTRRQYGPWPTAAARVQASPPCAPRRSATARSPSTSIPIPSPRRASCWSACGPPGSTAPTCCSSRAAIRRPPGAPPGHPGPRAGRRGRRRRPRRHALRAGDRVMAIVGGGGQAELAVVHERAAMPVPDELDWTAAGGVPEAFTTAHDALFTQAGLTVGERAARARRRRRRRHGRRAARDDGRRARHRDGPRRGRPRADRRARRPGARARRASRSTARST